MTGNEYADLIGRYVAENFGHRGVMCFRELAFGRTTLGKRRRVDVLVINQEKVIAVAMECKFQMVSGSADEKIPHALDDVVAMPIPSCLVYAGSGFCDGVIKRLSGSPVAVACLPGHDLARTRDTTELDELLAAHFGWWDIIIGDARPIVTHTL